MGIRLANGRKKSGGSSGSKGKKKGGRRSGKRTWLWPAIILGILLLTLAATYFVLSPRPVQKKLPPPIQTGRGPEPPIHYEETGQAPDVAILNHSDKKHGSPPSATTARPAEKPAATDLPLVAIVIDDMGYQDKTGEELLDLDLDLTFAFLPHGPHTGQMVAEARQRGRDILLHFPMEAADQKWDPGPGAVTLEMSRAQIRKTFAENLRLVPLAQGINNHMGSRFTQNQEAMRDFLELVRDRRLFFLDSMTSQSSVGYSLAREMGIKTTRRNVFLDNVRERGPIVAQIEKLLTVADKQGWAVGIGHPYPQTLDALRHARSEILRRARLVGVGRLVH